MLKKIPVKKLKVGHYIEKLDHGWFSTPFLFHHFKIKSQNDIQKLIDNDIHEVHINTEKGLDVYDEDVIKKTVKESIDYITIDAGSLIIDTVISFNLYHRKNGEYILYLKSGLPIHPEIFYDIKENNIERFYIDERERPLFNDYCNNIKKEKELSDKGLAKNFETAEKVKIYNEFISNYMPINPSIYQDSISHSLSSLNRI